MNFLLRRILATRGIRHATSILAIVTLGGCASFEKTASPLPIETEDATGGEIASTNSFEADGRLYVSGRMRKGSTHRIPRAAHVEVQLIAADGRVLREVQDDIDPDHPRRERATGGRYSYVASFPIADARKAHKIIVRYHREDHCS